jgi:hypothetical protein
MFWTWAAAKCHQPLTASQQSLQLSFTRQCIAGWVQQGVGPGEWPAAPQKQEAIRIEIIA